MFQLNILYSLKQSELYGFFLLNMQVVFYPNPLNGEFFPYLRLFALDIFQSWPGLVRFDQDEQQKLVRSVS